MTDLNENALKPCPFCGKAMMLRGALWPSEGDTDAVMHAEPTDCPMYDFCDGTADGSIAEKWNRRAHLEAATPSDVAGLVEGAWSYRINYGPDGQEDWANLVTPTGEHVANIRTHHAIAIVTALASLQTGKATS